MSRQINQYGIEITGYEGIVGKHVYGNLYGCDKRSLSDVKLLRTLTREAAEMARMTLIEVNSWKFGGDKGGVSVIALVVESHIAIHTWPNYRYATVDVFTCGEKSNPEYAFEYICSILSPTKVVKHYADRSTTTLNE